MNKLTATKLGNNAGGTYVEEYTVKQEKTLRDEFAMAALTGLLLQYSTKYHHEEAIKESYQIADAMMKAREN